MSKKAIYAEDLLCAIRDDPSINGAHFARIRGHIEAAQEVTFATDNNVGGKWIPVTERLPQEKGEICKNVILFMDDGLVTVGWLNEDIMSAFYLDTRNDFVSRVPMSRCTHWMPLPEPPGEE